MKKELLKKLCCPKCRLDFKIKASSLLCMKCKSNFRVKGNIIYILPEKKEKVYWDKLYENEKAVIKSAEFFLKNKKSIPVYYNSLSVLGDKEIKSSLEIGSGTGSYSLFLKKLGLVKEVFLVDYSVNALKLAQSLFEYFNEDAVLVCADAFSLPFKDKAFDVSLSSGLVEHFNIKLQDVMVSEHCRVAKKTLIQVPYNNPVYRAYKKAYILLTGGWPFGFEKPLKKRELKRLIIGNGMKIERVFYHDLLTAIIFQLSKKGILGMQTKKRFLNRFFRHEIGILAKT